MGEHGDQVTAGIRVVGTLMPESNKVLAAFGEGNITLFDGNKVAAGNIGRTGGCIGPVGEFVAIFKREIKQGGEHLCGQINRDLINPVKGLSDRQAI